MKKVIIIIISCLLCSCSSNNYEDNSSDLIILLNKIDEVASYVLKSPINISNSTLIKYPDLEKYLLKANIDIPIYDNMTPQGLAIIPDYYLITAYDNENINNSEVYVLSKYGNLKNTIKLNNKAHVGSIYYDQENNLIWLPNTNGILDVYNSTSFLNNNPEILYSFTNISEDLIYYQDSSQRDLSYLTIHNGYLYIGSFSYKNNGLVKKYKITIDNLQLNLSLVTTFKVPDKVQSISFYENNNISYLLLTRSYGRNNPSFLEIYQYDSTNDNYNLPIKSLKLPPMLEQIAIKDNKIYAIFESNASKYIDSKDKINSICVLDLLKILNC